MNYLKPTLPLVAGLVFGLSFVAAQTPALNEIHDTGNFRSPPTRPFSIATASKTEVTKLKSVLVTSAPQSHFVSVEPTKTPSEVRTNRRGRAKPKLDLNPAYSKPDFGNSDRLLFKELTPVELGLPKSKQLDNSEPTAAFFDKAVRYPGPPIRHVPDDRSAGELARRAPAPHASLKFLRSEQTIPLVVNARPTAEPTLVSKSTTSSPTPIEVDEFAPKATVRTESKPAALTTQKRPPARLNVRALSERVEAHNYSVATLERQLEEQQSWDQLSLQMALEEVRDIQKQKDVWNLYWNILDEAKRNRIGDILSLDGVYDKLQQRIFETQVEAELENTLASEAKQVKAALQEMDQIVADWRDQ